MEIGECFAIEDSDDVGSCEVLTVYVNYWMPYYKEKMPFIIQ